MVTPATPLVSLLTDFGLRDAYVGILHGVIAGLAPAVRVVDLCHEVPPQAVAQAGYLLASAAPYFPPGAVHVAVVDPGVGSARRILCAETARATFLAPDNGLLTRALAQDPPRRVVSVEDPRHFLPDPSPTFHGRDVFAPVAARLATGLDPGALGPEVETWTRLPDDAPRSLGPGRLAAEVVHVDRFGNLITSHRPGAAGVARARVGAAAGGVTVEGPLARCYAERPAGSPLLLVGSTGHLEVSVRDGSAADLLRAGAGTAVEVWTDPGTHGFATGLDARGRETA